MLSNEDARAGQTDSESAPFVEQRHSSPDEKHSPHQSGICCGIRRAILVRCVILFFVLGIGVTLQRSSAMVRLVVTRPAEVAVQPAGVAIAQVRESIACESNAPTFITFAFSYVGRWTVDDMLAGLRLMYSSLVRSQRCDPLLYVYTNSDDIVGGLVFLRTTMGTRARVTAVLYKSTRINGHGYESISRSRRWCWPICSGGSGSEGSRWHSMSRHKLDIMKRHLLQGEQPVWIDLDTLVLADLSLVFRNSSSWVLGWQHGRTLRGGTLEIISKVTIPMRSNAQGDLWAVDMAGIDEVERLEASLLDAGTELPQYDLQGYFSIILATNRTTTFRIIQDIMPAFAFGFECSRWDHPTSANFKPRVATNELNAGGNLIASTFPPGAKREHLTCGGRPAAVLSFTAPSFKKLLLYDSYFSPIEDNDVRNWLRAYFYDADSSGPY